MQLNSNSFDHIKESISETCKSETLKENRLKAKDTAWQNRGHAGEAVYTFLTELRKTW